MAVIINIRSLSSKCQMWRGAGLFAEMGTLPSSAHRMETVLAPPAQDVTRGTGCCSVSTDAGDVGTFAMEVANADPGDLEVGTSHQPSLLATHKHDPPTHLPEPRKIVTLTVLTLTVGTAPSPNLQSQLSLRYLSLSQMSAWVCLEGRTVCN